MSTNKIMALVGNILMTLSTLFAIVCSFIGFSIFSNYHDWYYVDGASKDFFSSSDSMSSYYYDIDFDRFLSLIAVLLVIIVLIAVVMNIFTWIAFAKMEGPHGRGWKIFLLIMGILNIGSFFAGIFFILAFALNSTKKPVENTTIN
ncbi:hypothetical protein [Lactovum odontotermitis]